MARDPIARRRICKSKKRKKRKDPEAEKQKRAAKKLDKGRKDTAREERMERSLAKIKEAKDGLLDVRKLLVLTDKLLTKKIARYNELGVEIDEHEETLKKLPDRIRERRDEYRQTIYEFIDDFPEHVEILGLDDEEGDK